MKRHVAGFVFCITIPILFPVPDYKLSTPSHRAYSVTGAAAIEDKWTVHPWSQAKSPGPAPKKARTPADYAARTLKELDALKSRQDLGDKQERMIVHPELFPSRVSVTCHGSERALPDNKREVIRQWARLYAGNPESYTTPYETEILFKENEDEHWIAVPSRRLASMKEELKNGDEVVLYVIRMGKVREGDNWLPVILIEDFARAK
jgi:hypothetical protein